MHRRGLRRQSVTVQFATADGSARAPTDYSAEPNETFFVNLSAPVNATIADAQGAGVILNDD